MAPEDPCFLGVKFLGNALQVILNTVSHSEVSQCGWINTGKQKNELMSFYFFIIFLHWMLEAKNNVWENSAFNRTLHLLELQRIFCWKSVAMFYLVQVEFKQNKKVET